MGQTPYTETDLLIAVMEGEDEEAQTLLDGMLPGELRTFLDRIRRLETLVVAQISDQARHA